MRTIISRWFMFGLLLGWSLTHATVFGQTGKSADDAKPTPIGKIRAGLDKSVTIDFTGQSLVDVLNHFRDKVGVPINLDPVFLPRFPMFNPNPNDPMGQQVTIKGTNEKAGTILRRTLSAQRLSFVILEDGVLITSEDAAVQRQMRQRVNVDVSDVPLKKAARELARNHGVNLVIDPKVGTEANTSVSLQVDDTTLETALRLMAEMADLKAVRLGNVMYITSEARAKKIREEEQSQQINPMTPFAIPQIGGGWGGGFGGVGGAIALPARPVPAPGVAVPGVAAPPMPLNPIDPAPPIPPVKPVAPPKAGTTSSPPPPPPPPVIQRPDQPVQSPPRRP